MTLAHRSREPEHGRIRDVMAITNINKGTGELTCNEDNSPSLKGMSHDSKATSTIGQGSEHPSDTFKQHERSVPTSVSPTQDTQLTSQLLWTLWIWLTVEPLAPDPGDQVAFEQWKYVYKEYMIKMQEYMNFCSGLNNLVMGQCTEALKEHLKSHEDFVGANQNGITLLVLICSLLHTFEECHKLADDLSDMKMAFYKLRQGKYMKLECYHEIFLV